MSSIIIIKTTVNDIVVKNNIIDALISGRFSSCINVIENISSHYIWKNKIVQEREEIMLIKTLFKNEKKIYEIIKKLHNYDVPEIITLNTLYVDNSYSNWVNKTISNKKL